MVEIPVRVRSGNKELKSLLFDNGDKIEFSDGAALVREKTDAEFGGFESQIVIEMTAAISSTQDVEPISRHLYNSLKDLDSVEVLIKGEETEMDENILRRRLMSGYYKN